MHNTIINEIEKIIFLPGKIAHAPKQNMVILRRENPHYEKSADKCTLWVINTSPPLRRDDIWLGWAAGVREGLGLKER